MGEKLGLTVTIQSLKLWERVAKGLSFALILGFLQVSTGALPAARATTYSVTQPTNYITYSASTNYTYSASIPTIMPSTCASGVMNTWLFNGDTQTGCTVGSQGILRHWQSYLFWPDPLTPYQLQVCEVSNVPTYVAINAGQPGGGVTINDWTSHALPSGETPASIVAASPKPPSQTSTSAGWSGQSIETMTAANLSVDLGGGAYSKGYSVDVWAWFPHTGTPILGVYFDNNTCNASSLNNIPYVAPNQFTTVAPTSYGSFNSSVTLATKAGKNPPTVSESSTAASITTTGAVVSGTVVANNDTITAATFRFGTDAALTSSSDTVTNISQTFSSWSDTSTQTASLTLSGLTPYTTYYYSLTATNSTGSQTSQIYSFTTLGIAPTISGVSISGTTTVGQTLTTSLSGVGGMPTPTASYQWYEANSLSDTFTPISGAINSTYALLSSDRGKYLKVTTNEVNSLGTSSTVTSSATSQIAGIQYSVSFNSNGGSGSMVNQSSNVTANLTANAFTRTGYTFTGWNTAADGSGSFYADSASYLFLSGTTLYAQWSSAGPTYYFVSFNANGGTGGMQNETGTVSQSLTANTYTYAGHTFVGWNTLANGSGTSYADGASYPFNASTTLYAQWRANSYVVTFSANGGTGSMSTETSSASANLLANTFTRANYNFTGWNTLSNGSGTGYADQGIFPFTSSTTLYAQWSQQSNTVTFNSNGGSGAMNAQTANAPTALTSNAFLRINYSFKNWNTAADGSGTSYNDGASFPFTSTVTLYAQWTVGTLTTRTISLTAGASLTAGSSETLSATPSAGGSDGTISYSVGASTACSVSGSTLTATASSGTCVVTASISAGTTYASATSAPTTVTVSAATRTIAVTVTPSSLVYGSTAIVTSTPSAGASDGTVTYSVGSSTGCSLSGATISVTSASGTCSVTATIGAGVLYASATSAPATNVALSKAPRTISFTSYPTSLAYGSTANLVALPSVGSGDGNVGYSVGSSTACTISGSLLKIISASGTCSITASILGGTNYADANSSSVSVSPTTASLIIAASAIGVGLGETFTPTASATGLVDTNTLGTVTFSYSSLTYGPTQTAPTAAGTYTITPIAFTLSHGIASNYTASYTTATLNINGSSISGLTSLTQIGTLTASSSLALTFTGTDTVTGTSVAVAVPAGSLPNGDLVTVYILGDHSQAAAILGSHYDFAASVVVAWDPVGGVIPVTAAGLPIQVTITKSTIRKDQKVYGFIGGAQSLLATATTNGSVSFPITQDPELEVVSTTPGAPTAVSGTVESGQSTVSWTIPSSDGGSAITAYTVTSDPGGFTCTASGATATSCIVSGLTNGTPYTFSVVATNALGNGNAGLSSPVTPITTPDAPTAVSGTVESGPSTVSWTIPASNGGSAITGYTVTSSPGGFTCTASGPTATSCIVTGLANGTPYTFSVVAINASGSSSPGVTAMSVTPVNSAPSITSLSPNFGSIDGGNAVTISGLNLGGATTVSIGGNSASVTSTTSTSISVIMPAGAAGLVGVQISFSSGAPLTVSNAYTYYGSPVISISVGANQSITLGSAITTTVVTNTGGSVSSFGISPALPAGLALDPATGAISGTPVALLTSSGFTLTATGTYSGTSTATFTLEVISVGGGGSGGGGSSAPSQQNPTLRLNYPAPAGSPTYQPGVQLLPRFVYSGNGIVAYTTSSPSSVCTVDATTGIVTTSANGICTVVAHTSATATFAAAFVSISLTVNSGSSLSANQQGNAGGSVSGESATATDSGTTSLIHQSAVHVGAVYFATGSWALSNASKAALVTYSKKLIKLNVFEVYAIGNADQQPAPNNLQISQNRANAVVKFLKQILPAIKYSTKGIGATKLKFVGTTPTELALNRRVDIYFSN